MIWIWQALAALILGGVACRMATLRRPEFRLIWARHISWNWTRRVSWRERAKALGTLADFVLWVSGNAAIGTAALLVFFGRSVDEWALYLFISGNAVIFTLRWARKAT